MMLSLPSSSWQSTNDLWLVSFMTSSASSSLKLDKKLLLANVLIQPRRSVGRRVGRGTSVEETTVNPSDARRAA